ncbi:DEAD/DEAH box helicase [Candidatus Woesearchaeota archaeon]|nr:MAG: DEAD/DEAH box helicase [Candidatus Woesearchaeota archaeon]
MLREDIKPRAYQSAIAETAAQHNTLVVLPTGMGKTLIAELVLERRLSQYPGGKALILAPTRPLVQQHCNTFKEELELEDEEIAMFTGTVKPEKRAQQWKRARIIFSTPQGLENDILGNRITLSDVVLLVVDEAHRAVGDYAYVFIAERYRKQASHERILALTASPGSDKESIERVCTNLGIEEIEVRTAQSPDVQEYIQAIDVTHVTVKMPKEFRGLHSTLQELFTDIISRARAMGALNKQAFTNKTTLLKAQAALHASAARGQKDYGTLKTMSLLAEALKVQHAIELIETQGVTALNAYLDKLEQEAARGQSKAVKNLVANPLFAEARRKSAQLKAAAIEHPKLRAVKKLLLQERYANPDCKVILFTQYRDQAVTVKAALDSVMVTNKIFVGQAKKGETGMSQKEQRAILEGFRAGEFTCLIATSVAEEGLDIPKVDLVVFYEPVPSAIRTVQRRGRTGRLERGRVVMLVTDKTKDSAYRWVAHHKERRMYRALKEVRAALKKGAFSAPAIEQSPRPKHPVRITADHREKASGVLKELVNLGATLTLEQLATGDYHLSDRVVVEYKRVPDFVDSIIDGRLLSQLRALRSYPRALIIVEGDEDLFAQRNMHPNAILGMLATISVNYNIPLLFTRTPRETAALLFLIAQREQTEGREHYAPRTQKPMTLTELQEFIVSSLPGVGGSLAKALLEHCGSVRAVMNASAEELQAVEKIGQKKAKEIQETLTARYERAR